jgi:hypothetical protein
VYEFDAPADEDLVVSLERIDDVDLVVDASVAFTAMTSVMKGAPVKVDSHTRGVIDGFVTTVVHPIDLRDGDRIQIAVRAGASDAFFTLVPPGGRYDPFGVPSADDGGGGLYGLDPKKSFDIDQTGTWRIVISTYDAVVDGYDLDVRRMG